MNLHLFVLSCNMIIIVLYAWLLCFSQQCLAADTLNAGQRITGNGTVLVSSGEKFELGFFSPLSGIGGEGRYLGVWYHRQNGSEQITVVWVANRDDPLPVDTTGVFQIADDGNLVVMDTFGKSYWSSNLRDSSAINRTVKLMDSGNLLLLNGIKLWESFEHPTDTFLPGMKMDRNLQLTCWKSAQDPGSGNFTFKMEPKSDNRFIILNQSQIYWESEEQRILNSEKKSDDMSTEVYNFLTNFTVFPLMKITSYEKTRLLLNYKGMIQFLGNDFEDAFVQWQQPRTKCLTYNACGNFTSCNDNDEVCKCLPGFVNPLNDDMGGGYSSSHCTRRKSASCGEDKIKFLNLTMVKIGSPDERVKTENEAECKRICRQQCLTCRAYSYSIPTQQRELNPYTCWIWTHNLPTLKEEYLDGADRILSVLVDKSDLAPTPRTCEPCGTNIVPYPLSTGPSCGDPAYSKFSCNSTTLELRFSLNTTTSYRVTSINPRSRKFFIRVIQNEDDSFNRYCGEESRNNEDVKVSSPFNTTNNSQCSEKAEVIWQPPSEPTCGKPSDCEGWKHTTCKGKRCLCDANYYWHGETLNCTENAISPSKPTIEEATGKENSKSSLSLILGITLPGVVILACIIIFAYVCRRKIALKLKQDKESIQRNRGRFYDSERQVKDLIDIEGLKEKDNEGIDVPYFDFESILEATDNFSDANMLGKGGYGSVYKGKLPSGQDIAVKRLSSVSSQGLQEFKNEVVLIAKLQHRNLVRLRGYCIRGYEKILLYEYMPNKSLDSFIFDPTKSVLLDWQMRFEIILGIARGLLYLHQDSRLRVIHRDLKTSNILLDGEMQPKISDFGLAKIFAGKETEASTERVVGTYGYMSPEYALDGHFSTKSDVFSFGVLLLEIISGKKNTGFYHYKEISSLLGYGWKLWKESKLLELMDATLHETCNANQFIRCAHIALLCVQDEPDDRPNMSNVVIMLDSETAILPTPKEPTFFTRKEQTSTASSSLQFESNIQEGR